MNASGKRKGGATRAERLAAALRQNLRRRKAAARARDAAADCGLQGDTVKPPGDGLKPAAKDKH